MDQQRNEFLEQLRTIYGEVAGSGVDVTALSHLALQNEISIKSRKGEDQEARRRIYDEWAGRSAPPQSLTSRPPVERLWRLVAEGADEFQERLTPLLGEEEAREIARKLVKSSVVIRDEDECAL
jgi:hypothetical protein